MMARPTDADLAGRDRRAIAAANLRSLSDVYELLAQRARGRDDYRQVYQASNDFACVLEEMAADLVAGEIGPEELAIFRQSADRAAAAIERMTRSAAPVRIGPLGKPDAGQ